MSQKPKSRRKTTKIEQTPTLPTQNPTPPEFHFAIARIAVSQISQSVGFKSTKPSALETLTNIAVKYIGAVASASASYAAMAKRTNTNVFDFANALHDLQSVQGFRGASALHENGFCVLGSSVLSDLAGFVRWNRETPFAGPIPRVEKLGAEKRGNEVPIPPELDSRRGLHVPRWLPAFPDMGKAVGKRRNGEELWENVVASNGGSGGGGEGEGESGNGKGNCRESVGKSKRGRVRFRVGGGEEESGVVGGMGVDLRSGVCRGGKRVSWSNSKIGYTNFSTRTRIHEFVDDDDDDDDGDKR